MNKKLNIVACRNAQYYTRSEYIGRFFWSILSPLFYLSPRTFFGWRNFLLRIFGAKVGKQVHIYPSAQIYLPWKLSIGDESSIGEWALIYNLGVVKIGSQVTISHRAHLCAGTHDYTNSSLPLKRSDILINSQAWVCSDVFIGPDVKIGEGAILAARSVVMSDVLPWQIVAGHPAIFKKKRKIKHL
jgi:putative colanic acid biosynthesis acetyltransferase WcaF